MILLKHNIGGMLNFYLNILAVEDDNSAHSKEDAEVSMEEG